MAMQADPGVRSDRRVRVRRAEGETLTLDPSRLMVEAGKEVLWQLDGGAPSRFEVAFQQPSPLAMDVQGTDADGAAGAVATLYSDDSGLVRARISDQAKQMDYAYRVTMAGESSPASSATGHVSVLLPTAAPVMDGSQRPPE